MAMFKYFIKTRRPVMLSMALGVTIASSIALSMSVGQVFAKDHFASSTRMPTGFDPYLTSIHQIQTGAADDADVRLKGRLTGYLYDNNYEFTDEFGQSIEVELDDDTDWSFVHKDQLIEILGEVERNMFKVKVEARYYRILEEVQSSMHAQSSDVAATATVAMSDETSSQDTNSSVHNNVSALSAMTSDEDSGDTHGGAAENTSPIADAAQDKVATDQVVAAEYDSAPMGNASMTDTNTTKNKQALDKVVVSSTTTTVKTVTVSENTSAADAKQVDTADAAQNSTQPASATSSKSN